jgi:peptidoglycan/xylan/chitin deacetylase (PgdA/CDA1 family)
VLIVDGALKTIIGVRPIFMRPPFGSLNGVARSYLEKNGYQIVDWGIDTNDWRHPDDINASLAAYRDALTSPGARRHGFIGLEHDTLGTTAERLAPIVIKYAKEQGFNVVPVGACLGLDPSQWYRQ